MTEARSFRRRRGALVVVASMAWYAARAAGAPATIKTIQNARVPMPAEVADRLRKAGLDPNSRNLASELRALASRTGPAYVRSHTLSLKATRVGGAAVMPGLPAGHPVARKSAELRPAGPIQGIPQGIWQATGPGFQTTGIGNRPISPTGGYFVLVSTGGQKAEGAATVDTPLPASAAISVGCTPAYANGSFHPGDSFVAVDSRGQLNTLELKLPTSMDGVVPAYYVNVPILTLPIGRPRAGQLAVSFANVSGSPSYVTFVPETLTVTVAATVDHAPALAGAGSVAPWGGTGIGPGNASLGSPGVPRVGDGTNYQTQTQGDDLVGSGVSLGPGWKVTSTAIRSASSAVAPDVLVPDNSWRGAEVKQLPQGSDLRTITHWHYSGIDSLDYTIEWTLQGPAGQRPLLTMQKIGDCDS